MTSRPSTRTAVRLVCACSHGTRSPRWPAMPQALLAVAWTNRRFLQSAQVKDRSSRRAPTASRAGTAIAVSFDGDSLRKHLESQLQVQDPNPDKVYELLEHLASHEPKMLRDLSPFQWRTIVLTLGRSNSPEVSAKRVVKMILWKQKADVPVNQLDVHILAQASAFQRRTAEEAEAFLVDVKELLHIDADCKTYAMLARGLFQSGHFEEVSRLVANRMAQKGDANWKRDMCLTVVAELLRESSMLGKTKKRAEMSDSELKKCEEQLQMVVRSILDAMRQHLGPNSITTWEYNRVISVSRSSVRTLADAKVILEQMEQEGYRPNIGTYNFLLDHLMYHENPTDANELLNEVELKGVKPHLDTWRIMIAGYIRLGRVHAAITMYRKVGDTDYKLRQKLLSQDPMLAQKLLAVVSKEGGLTVPASMLAKDICRAGLVPAKKSITLIMRKLLGQDEISCALSLYSAVRSLVTPTKREASAAENEPFFDTPLYNYLISSLLSVRNEHEALKLFDDMEIMGCPPDVITFTILINWFAKEGDSARVATMLEEMSRRGIKRDVVLYSTILGVMIKNGRLGTARNIVQEMREVGIEPNEYTYNIFMNGLLRAGLDDQAEKLWEDMKAKGVATSCVGDGTLLNGLLKNGKLERAMVIWEHIQAGQGLMPPDAMVYRAAVDLYCVRGDLETAERVMRQSADCRGALTAEVYNTMIVAYLKHGREEDARRLVDEMKAKGSGLVDEITYSILVHHALRNGDLRGATKALEDALQIFKRRIDPSIYTPVVTTIAKKTQSLSEALRIVDLVKSYGIAENALMCAAIVAAHTAVRSFDGATEYIHKIRRLASELDSKSHAMNSILDWYGKQGKSESMERIFNLMLEGKWGLEGASAPKLEPDSSTWTILICGYGYGNEWEKALNIWKQQWRPKAKPLLNSSVLDTDRAFEEHYGVKTAMISVVIDALAFSNRLDEIHEVWNQLRSAKVPLDPNNYTSLIEALVRCDKVPAACKVVMEEMPQDGVNPTQKLFRNFLGLLSVRKDKVSRQTEKDLWAYIDRHFPEWTFDLKNELPSAVVALNVWSEMVERAKAKREGEVPANMSI
ncbi:pentatricopeptide repeat domain-containing protein [Spizellomyces punctatus DAOM BR117]|uniref:Pentatricopeptide repeat domain-containing protein n=1 Tax=Spizellomyces punctatus (strain DAOM BR117) TaxID=645134 RepID=A0A0L0HNE3_SPIPD|nr:pentatricopeptide repeat domain-containing protein [Spizellomyces punctatus DAOM BR117]KND02951.1 pentatricopeptide repeat domain-containing protein [Spizellomyces punctatus DAOM BR117]|eukprot:XP_016610990.1 pentatricopeptide repeat domain-containing protein [Spizellomyces punctatus DAOM BR117]